MKKRVLRRTSLVIAVILAGVSVPYTTAFAKETEQGEVGIVYAEGVVTDLDADYQCANETDEVKVITQDEKTAEELQKGDILILPAVDEMNVEHAIEISSVKETEKGYIIEGTEADAFSDIVEYVDIAGTALANRSDILPEEGVSVTATDWNASERSLQTYRMGASGVTNLTPLCFQIDCSLGTVGSIKGSIVMTPALEYRLLFDFGGIQELALGLKGRMEISDLRVTCSDDGVLPIATIPYTFGNGMFTSYVTVNLVYSAEGEAYLTYAMDGYCGVSYDGQKAEFESNYDAQDLTYGMAGSLDVKTNICMGLVAYGSYTLMDAELNAGVAAEVQKQGAELYFYLNGNYGQNSILSQYGICGSKVIYDRNNSPLKYEVTF